VPRLCAATKLLFIGDSITEWGRLEDPEALGGGYVRLIHDQLAARDPVTAPIVINQGIRSHQIPDLQARWQRDVLDHTPDVVSIYVGINDVTYGLFPHTTGCPLPQFVAGYHDILERTRQALPAAIIVLCEPSVLWLPELPTANASLKPYVAVVRRLAHQLDAKLVGLHDAFEQARTARPDIAWTIDGIHPSSAGHALIARLWLAAMNLL
jgi:lysophospholipase L1-like esterase